MSWKCRWFGHQWMGQRLKAGYGRFQVDRTRRVMASRWAYETFVDPSVQWGELECCHRCDNPPCVNPDHLFAGSRSDNVRDCVAKRRAYASKIKGTERARANGKLSHYTRVLRGTDTVGTRNPLSRLTLDQLREILEMKDRGVVQAEIARKFDAAESVISAIILGKTYKAEVRTIRALLDEPAKEGEA